MQVQRTLNWILNAVALGSVAVIATVLAKGHFQPALGSGRAPAAIREGVSLNLPKAQWARDGANLVMALSTECHYCRESAGFYRALTRLAPSTVHTIAVFPQPAEESTGYLRSEGIAVSEVLQADLTGLGVAGTPTLIVVDGAGHVRSVWTGKLSPEQERAVYEKLGIKASEQQGAVGGPSAQPVNAPAGRPYVLDMITAPELEQLLARHSDAPVLDIRDRGEFAKGHIAGAVNIPVDELETRAVHELPIDSTVMMYCNSILSCKTKLGASGPMPALCAQGARILRESGFEHLLAVQSDLDALRSAGVHIN